MDESNRRKHARVPVSISGILHFTTDKKHDIPCEILDISIGGAFIHCTAPIRIGQEVLVEIHFESNTLLSAKIVPPEELKMAAPAKSIVRWVRGSSRSGFGVEFLGLAQVKLDYLKRVVAYFDKLRQEAASE